MKHPNESTVTGLALPSRWLAALTVSVLAACALYLVAVISADANAVYGAAGQLSLAGWSVVLGLSLLNYLLRFLRWQEYLRALGHRLPLLRHATIYFSGFALTTTPAKAGEAVRSLYLHPLGVSYAQSLAALFAERTLDLLSMLALAGLGVVALGVNGGLVLAGAAICGVVVLLIRSPRLHAWVAGLPLRGHLSSLRDRFQPLLRASLALLSLRMLVGACVLGLLSWGAEGVGLYVIAQALGLDVSLELAIGIYALAMLGGAISFIPGGLGGAEAVMGALLVAAGASLPEAVAATLICRAATLWFAILLGMIAMAVLQLEKSWRTRAA
jgi:uncharacterized membrane protein YbhN (UPF0104 family)